MDKLVVPYHLDERLPWVELQGARVLEPVALPEGTPWERLAALYEPVAAHVARSASPLVVSADCTTALGTLAGLGRKGIEPSVVWFDAHGDFNTHETTITGYLGGMPLAVACGRGDQTVCKLLGLRPLREERVVLSDARDLDPLERLLLKSSAVRLARVDELQPPDGDIYLHVDFDVLDPSEMEALQIPVPGGARLETLLGALSRVVDTGRVVGAGFGWTFHPQGLASPKVRRVLDAVMGVLSA